MTAFKKRWIASLFHKQQSRKKKKIAKGTEGQQTTNKKEETASITLYRTTLQIVRFLKWEEGHENRAIHPHQVISTI